MASYAKRYGKWQARISWRDADGKLHQKAKGGFANKQAAKQYAVKMESKQFAGDNIEADPIFADYFDKWFDLYKKNKISPVTARHYRWTSSKLHEYFKKRKLKSVTRAQYQSFINAFGADHSKESIKKLHSLCRACVSSAVFDGILSQNFTDRISLVWDDSKQYKVEYLSIKEIQKLIASCLDGIQPCYISRYMILTAMYTGARVGEIMALTWKDINAPFKTITINKSWDYHMGGGFKPTKNASSVRTIRVNTELIDRLQDLHSNNSKMVFGNEQGEIPSSSAVNKCLRHMLKKAGLKKHGFHFHSLRHSHVAFLLSQGVNLYSISKRLGHSNMTTTAKTYSYLIDEYKQRSDDRIEDCLNTLNSTTVARMLHD